MKLNISKVFYSFFIVVLYFLLGSLLLYKYVLKQEAPDFRMAGFAVVVIGYGIYRGYRTYREYKKTKEEEIDDV
jgi:small neutral amino acid transporter SnatA (MarC family)